MNYKEIIDANRDWIDGVWNKIINKMEIIAPTAYDKIPYSITKEGRFNDCNVGEAPYDITWWTNGFWPAYMWLLYIGTDNEMYKEIAQNAENMLDAAFKKYESLHHDVGFMWHISSGVNYRLTENKDSLLRELFAGDMLASRFNPAGGYIRSWNETPDEDGGQLVIIDSMMNIPLLYWIGEYKNDIRYKNMAMIHADTIMKTHIRADGTSNHIVKLNPQTGEKMEEIGGQGYGVESAWTRGQAWAIYGFALSYIHTGRNEYIDTAKKVANAFIACAAQNEWIIPVDFRQPDEPKYYDATAAACAACGLIEIAKHVTEYDQKNYITAAIQILKAIDEKAADYSTNCDNLLNYCSEAYKPSQGENGLNTAIIYGDYFYTEAFYKMKELGMLFW